jgi:hypothetical protein
MGSGEGEAEAKRVQVLGRVPVARALRIDGGRDAPAVPLEPPRPADVLCSRCGATLCDGARRMLFAGMVLRCACGETARVQRGP